MTTVFSTEFSPSTRRSATPRNVAASAVCPIAGEAARTGEVIRFVAPRPRRQARAPSTGFMPEDMAALREWEGGGRRIVLCDAEGSLFVMLYEHSTVWASWAVSRGDNELTAWNCVTHADIGRFETMADALDALPSAPAPAFVPLTSNVIRFRIRD